jgi:hypothetical protein
MEAIHQILEAISLYGRVVHDSNSKLEVINAQPQIAKVF